MKIKHHYKAALIFSTSLISLIIALLGTAFYCIEQSKILHTYNVTLDTPYSSSNDIFIEMWLSKQWYSSGFDKNKNIGAQYNAILTNSSKYYFKVWTVQFEYSSDLTIDSSWNGKYTVNGNQVSFIPKGDQMIIAPGSSITLGTIMYSTEVMTLESYKLKGYKEVSLNNLSIFWVLIALFITWYCTLISYIAIHYKTIMYRDRLALDSKIISQSIDTLANFIDAKDAYTKNHSKRVAAYSAELGYRLNMPESEVKSLYYIALMHDCGKIGIPDYLLNKKSKLTDEEYRIIQSHTVMGAKMLADFIAIPNVPHGAHYHHERFDGQGYPKGLKGTNIPLCARIICIADAYDAMSSTRCYRKALSKEKVLSEMLNNSGKQFDPEINMIMISLIKNGFVDKIKEKYPRV